VQIHATARRGLRKVRGSAPPARTSCVNLRVGLNNPIAGAQAELENRDALYASRNSDELNACSARVSSINSAPSIG
jgi:hypothetical protein